MSLSPVGSVGIATYLHQLAQDQIICKPTMARTLEAWGRLAAAAKGLPAPDATPGPDGQVLYTWDRDRHHLELEILPAGPAEFFYRDRRSGGLWECEFELSEAVPE